MKFEALTRAVMDFIFPGACVACRAECAGDSPLCAKCFGQLERLETSPRCRCCAMPSAYPDAPCSHCRGEGMHPFARIVALGRYDDPVRGIIHALKYHRAWPLAEYLADRLAVRDKAAELLAACDVVVPVPLHRIRSLTRGYNQAAIIAKRFCNPPKNKLKLSNALARVRHTETQTHLHSHAKRYANVLDAFALIRESDICDKRVVLVDDVMTTGATLREAAKALRRGKPASVSALVLAVADPKGRGFERT